MARTLEDDLAEAHAPTLRSFHDVYAAEFSDVKIQLVRIFGSPDGHRAILDVVTREGGESVVDALSRALDKPVELVASAEKRGLSKDAKRYIYLFSSTRLVNRLTRDSTKTPEMLAKYLKATACSGYTVSVYSLLAQGANPFFRDATGKTPADYLEESCAATCNIANVFGCKHAEARLLMCGCRL